jgi:hypothetical protein
MKNAYVILFLLASFSFSSLLGQENKPFEGTLVYAIEYTGNAQQVSKVANMLPDTMRWQFKDGKALFEMTGGMSAALMNRFFAEPRPGKMYMMSTSQRISYPFIEPSQKLAWDNPKSQKSEVIHTEEEAEFVGLNATHHRVVMATKHGIDTTEYWMTRELDIDIPNSNDLTGSGLFATGQFGFEGFPVKIVYTMPVPSRDIITVATLVKVLPGKVEEKDLTVPAAYQTKEYHMGAPKWP